MFLTRTTHLIIALLTLLTSITPCFAETALQNKATPYGKATFFEHKNYQGRSFVIFAGGAVGNLRNKSRGVRHWNDAISSVYIEGTISVNLYANTQYNGSSLVLNQSVSDLTAVSPNINWNDTVSSVSTRSVANNFSSIKITFYDNPGYSGKSFILNANDGLNLKDKRRGSSRKDWNDEIESLIIEGKARVVLFEHKDLNGKYLTLESNVADLAKLGWKKRASSVLVLPLLQ
jgi:hypothetical protein